jgi:hypothetical protein
MRERIANNRARLDAMLIQQARMEAAGFPPADGYWARFKSGWYQSLDLTGRENAEVRPSACCNKPPTRS